MVWLKKRFLLLLVLLFVGVPYRFAGAEPPLPVTVSIFNVSQGKVVQTRPLTDSLAKSVQEVLTSSPTLYEGLAMNPTSGLVLHIPYRSPIQVPNALYTSKVKELYLFLEKGNEPESVTVSRQQAAIVYSRRVELRYRSISQAEQSGIRFKMISKPNFSADHFGSVSQVNRDHLAVGSLSYLTAYERLQSLCYTDRVRAP